MTRFWIDAALTLLLGLVLSSCYTREPLDVPAEMQGRWQGEAKIIVSWCEQDYLGLELFIFANGAVTGTVGDAQLTDAFIRRNRGPLGDLLGFASDYLIEGGLSGDILSSETIQRESVKIILDFGQDEFTGGLHTSGTKIGGKDTMILSASKLVLRR